MKSLLIAAFLVLSLQPAFASIAPTELRVRTIHGEKDGRFLVQANGTGAWIFMTINNKKPQTRELKAKEWKFLQAEFKKLPQSKQVPEECARSRMDVVLVAPEKKKPESKASCFGETTATSAKYERFARILVSAFE